MRRRAARATMVLKTTDPKGVSRDIAHLMHCFAGYGWLPVAVSFALTWRAGVQDSRFEFSSDGTSVDFDVRDTSRREVPNQFFAGTDIEIQWTNTAFADQRISGKFSGTPTAVLQQLLAQSNFVIVRDGSGDTSRVVRVIIDGPTRREQSSAGLAALAATIKSPQQGAIAGAQAQQESLNRPTESPRPGHHASS
jgi:hypothetical protein